MLSKLLRPIAQAALLVSTAAVASCAAPSSTTRVTSGSVAAKPDPSLEVAWQEHAKGRGTSLQLQATPAQAWAAVHAAILWNDAGTPVDYQREGGEAYVLTKPATSSPSYENAQIGVWVDTMSTDKVELDVVVIGAAKVELGGPNENQVLNDIETAVDLLKAGKPLPDTHP